jgi:hypothetical protein
MSKNRIEIKNYIDLYIIFRIYEIKTFSFELILKDYESKAKAWLQVIMLL